MNLKSEVRPRQAIFFVTDLGFALPTLACALEVRKKVPRNRADIRIVTTDLPVRTFGRIAEFAAPHGIELNNLPWPSFTEFDHGAFHKTHVPMSSLARFFMLDAVPDIYDRILYLDGDTWPLGDPLKLLEASLPEGCLGAAEDRNYFRRHEVGPVGRKTRAYFSGLGINGDRGYFSAGVLLADTRTWRKISADAFAYFVDNTARCHYHDQSALNAVAGECWVRLAPQWNFMHSYAEWRLKHGTSPQILHFAGGDKPWTVPYHPYYQTYQTAFAPLRELGLPIQQYSQQRIAALARRARLRKLRDALFIHRRLYYQYTYDYLVKTSAIQ